MNGVKEFVKELAIAVVIAVLITQVVKPTVIKESSMEPTMYENNYVLLNRQAYNIGEPKRGDIIVFHTGLKRDDGKEKLLIKRVVGLPGEKVSIMDGKVYINDVEIKEDYIKDGATDGYIEGSIVPKGELFVMGDNRYVSVDSRLEQVGTVKINDVVGKAMIRLYPFDQIRTF